jgi:hypothetical protein
MLKSDINNKPNNNNSKKNSNSNRNNSNNKSNKQPSTRFNFVNDEPKVKVEPKVNKPNNDNVFIQKPKNDRFNMAKLTEEEPLLRNEYDSINRKPFTNLIHSVNPNPVNITTVVNNKSIENNTDVKVEQFPELLLRPKNKTSVENNNDNQNSYKKAIRHENVVVEDKRLIVKPGWVSIVKSEAGKSTIIYGPKTEYQKKVEYLRKNLNHQMSVAISNMEERWTRHEQIYNSLHGENAFNERYGYVPTCDLDDYNDYNHSDDDSDYEYETE